MIKMYAKELKIDKQNRMWQMDYLKALCIIFVIITHYGLTYSDPIRDNVFWLLGINMAVPVFIIISGYMQGLSCEKNAIFTLREYYTVTNLFKKLSSVIFPFLIIYLVESLQMCRMKSLTVSRFLYGLFTGGFGPGSFYPLIMIQLILIFPVLYFGIKKHPKQMLFIISGVSILLEIVAVAIHMDAALYRLLIIRYICFIAAGIYLYLFDFSVKEVFISTSLTIIFLYLIVFKDCSIRGFFFGWERAALPELPFAAFVVILGTKYMRQFGDGLIHKVILEIGQSTYFIFLVQMVWYHFAMDRYFIGPYISLVSNIFFCVFFGCIFKEVYSFISVKSRKGMKR